MYRNVINHALQVLSSDLLSTHAVADKMANSASKMLSSCDYQTCVCLTTCGRAAGKGTLYLVSVAIGQRSLRRKAAHARHQNLPRSISKLWLMVANLLLYFGLDYLLLDQRSSPFLFLALPTFPYFHQLVLASPNFSLLLSTFPYLYQRVFSNLAHCSSRYNLKLVIKFG